MSSKLDDAFPYGLRRGFWLGGGEVFFPVLFRSQDLNHLRLKRFQFTAETQMKHMTKDLQEVQCIRDRVAQVRHDSNI